MFQIASLYNDLLPKGIMASNAPVVAITTDTTTVGATIDLQGYARAVFVIITKTVTDGDYDVDLYHGNESDMSDEAAVSASDLNGTIPNWTADTDDNKYVSFEYVARKRYVRIKVVSTNTSSGVDAIGGVVLLGQPDHAPVQT